ncbi:MAG TPA: hypothetical protein PKA63_02990 [Oligoflexia bacterium]|nr:hypothetical protein [Oligoflexia bacterium]HMP47620.1 hypothetical protein [Oligoflexia bacterium]
MKKSSSSDYFESNSHKYMERNYNELTEYIFSKLSLEKTFHETDIAVEFGPGTGRFTGPIFENFNKIILIEPSRYYCELLHQSFCLDKFPDKEILIRNESLKSYFDNFKKLNSTEAKNVYIFGFHLLHHLDKSEKESLYTFIRDHGCLCLLVDPYYLNPLILIQILITPKMQFKEEYRYLLINKKSLKKELKKFHLSLFDYCKVVPVAPFLIQKLLLNNSIKTINLLEKIAYILPFLNSYHAYLIGSSKDEYNKFT